MDPLDDPPMDPLDDPPMGSKGAQHRPFPHSAHSGIDSPRHTLPLDKNTSPPQPVLPERILQETFSTTDIETVKPRTIEGEDLHGHTALAHWHYRLPSLRMTPIIATLSTHDSGHCYALYAWLRPLLSFTSHVCFQVPRFSHQFF
jgi:hypothetical protein